ncbi:hypothetical protein GCM10010911_47320 [Paenibacillus nasutitermitis]|uniref:Uncharacterized protein n=1 Tax=Paenibacillus nasutitermitis TaxID=1652958 RepID=A0A916ZB85_9BACL|nr:hypothetical protein GCM10010911_47320 [Paenibacillus nasutitermitis]
MSEAPSVVFFYRAFKEMEAAFVAVFWFEENETMPATSLLGRADNTGMHPQHVPVEANSRI